MVLKTLLNITLLTCIMSPVIAFIAGWIFALPIQECLLGSYLVGLALSMYFVSTRPMADRDSDPRDSLKI